MVPVIVGTLGRAALLLVRGVSEALEVYGDLSYTAIKQVINLIRYVEQRPGLGLRLRCQRRLGGIEGFSPPRGLSELKASAPRGV